MTEFAAQNLRGFGHCLELSERNVPRQIFHSAIGREDNALGGNVAQRAADALRHGLGRLYVHVAEIKNAEDDALARQFGQDRAIELRLGGLDRDLIDLAGVELGQERIS